MYLLRFVKGFFFWLLFTSLCVVIVLSSMRYLADRTGQEGLYAYWRGDIRDALEEARRFMVSTYEKGREKLNFSVSSVVPQEGRKKP